MSLEIYIKARLSTKFIVLKTNHPMPKYEYQVGGCLPPDFPSYIQRQADEDFYDTLKKGDFCYVLTAR